jgi:replication factor C subunit 3/5
MLNNNLPWVEKYRPIKFDSIISHDKIINMLSNLINNNHLPHIIFYGPPGTGKTTTILAAARKLYGSKYKSMILELNGSDDRGISVVREQIKDFSSTCSKISNIFKSDELNSNVKLIILDEADSMTFDAQFALRRVIELYTNNTRFCLICNYITKIIPALQSRCMLFRFAPIKFIDHYNKIEQITKLENIIIDENTLKKIILMADGDMRKSLNVVQSLHMIYKDKDYIVRMDDLNKLIGSRTESEILSLMNVIFSNEDIKNKYIHINDLLKKNMISIADIIKEIQNYLLESSYVNKNKNKTKIINIIIELSKIEIYSNNNSNNEILLLNILSIIELNKIKITK